MKPAVLLVLVLLAAGLAHAYSDYSFEADVNVNPDGTAHVTEKTIFVLETPEERLDFENKLNLGESTILEWQKFSRNIKFHFVGGVINPRITAKKEYALSFSSAAVILDYDLQNTLFTKKAEGSRRTVFTLDDGTLGFDATKSGETILGNGMKLAFTLPKDAELLNVGPPPDTQEANKLVWNGPITRTWELQFAREIPLSQEVGEFFTDAFAKSYEALPLLLFLGFAVIVAVLLVKYRNK